MRYDSIIHLEGSIPRLCGWKQATGPKGTPVGPAKGQPMGGVEVERLKVLVVEDNVHFRSLVRSILQALGIESVEEASDGSEAIEVLKSFPADVAIIDWKMAGLDGVECVRRIRTDDDSPNRFLPIVMVTGYTGESLINASRAAGVNDFLAKPISAKSLLSRIMSVIETSQPFFQTDDYFGPDRRRRQQSFEGPERRVKQTNRVPIPGEDGKSL